MLTTFQELLSWPSATKSVSSVEVLVGGMKRDAQNRELVHTSFSFILVKFDGCTGLY